MNYGIQLELFALQAKCDLKVTFGRAILKEDGSYHYPGRVLSLVSLAHTIFTSYVEADAIHLEIIIIIAEVVV